MNREKQSHIISEETIQEMKELLAEGHSISQVAEYIGVSHQIVRYHTVPGEKEKSRIRSNRWRKNNPDKALASVHKFRSKVKS